MKEINQDLFTNFFNTISSSIHFQAFNKYPSIEDRNSWNSLDKDYKLALINNGEKYLDFEFKAIPATLFMEFVQTGNRSHFEDVYFAKRRAFNALVLAECVENNSRFMPNIINGLFSILEESAWQLPAHNSYIRDTPQFILPDTTRPILDLFACETGALIATCYHLLKTKFDEISPFINTRIYADLNSRIITPYLNSHFWWMGNGDEAMCNWTVWCTQNVLLTAFSLINELSTDKQIAIVKQACLSIDCFLKDYGDDGCCNEGAQYYHHAGLCLFNSLFILNHITNNSFQPLFDNEKIKNIALYILNMHVDDEYYINYSDCSPIAGRCGIREFLFGKLTNQNNLMKLAAIDYSKTTDKLYCNEINLYYRLQAAFTHIELTDFFKQISSSFNNANSTNNIFDKIDIYYESVGIFIARDNTYTLSVKAGCNDDSHNHNDTGSITVYKNGKPFLIDVGVETYTKKTFSPDRYDIWTMQSAYHNLPTINATMQQNGREYKATDISVDLNPTAPTIKQNIAKAYPNSANVNSYIRTATLNKSKMISIKDSFDCIPNSVSLSLMTYEEPKLVDNSSNISFSIGSLGKIEFLSNVTTTIEEIPITDARLMETWKHNIYRINIIPTTNCIEFNII